MGWKLKKPWWETNSSRSLPAISLSRPWPNDQVWWPVPIPLLPLYSIWNDASTVMSENFANWQKRGQGEFLCEQHSNYICGWAKDSSWGTQDIKKYRNPWFTSRYDNGCSWHLLNETPSRQSLKSTVPSQFGGEWDSQWLIFCLAFSIQT